MLDMACHDALTKHSIGYGSYWDIPAPHMRAKFHNVHEDFLDNWGISAPLRDINVLLGHPCPMSVKPYWRLRTSQLWSRFVTETEALSLARMLALVVTHGRMWRCGLLNALGSGPGSLNGKTSNAGVVTCELLLNGVDCTVSRPALGPRALAARDHASRQNRHRLIPGAPDSWSTHKPETQRHRRRHEMSKDLQHVSKGGGGSTREGAIRRSVSR